MPVFHRASSRSFSYRPGLFFTAAFVATWIPWLLGAYLAKSAGPTGSISAFGYLGLLGPLVVTLMLVLASRTPLRADFWRRFDPRRLRVRYVAVAMAIPPLALLLSIGLSLPLGQSADQFRAHESHLILLALVLAPIIEEVSWRGYGVDSLRARTSVLMTTLLFGVLWSLWHLPLVLLPGTYQYEVAHMGNPVFLLNFFISAVPAAVIGNWLYYVNRRSILIGVLFHAASNAAAELLNAGQVAKTIATGVWALVALAIIVFDRTTFGAGPRNFIEEQSPANLAGSA